MTSRVLRPAIVAFLAAALAMLCCVVSFSLPGKAFADGTYSLSVAGGSSEAIKPGDTFTVNVNLANNESSSYTMYAMSTTLRYNSDMLELVDYSTANRVDAYTSAQSGSWSGWTDIVLNYKANTLKGSTWESPNSILTLTFRAVGEGSSDIMFRRVNISNSTGMGRYPCVCTDATVTIAYNSPSTPGVSDSQGISEGTTGGVSAPEADPSQLEGDFDLNNLTPDERKELEEMGYDVDALIAGKDGTPKTSASGKESSSASMSSAGSGAQGNDMSPVFVGLLVGLGVAVVALIVALIVYFRRK